jgi:hypothetical protein
MTEPKDDWVPAVRGEIERERTIAPETLPTLSAAQRDALANVALGALRRTPSRAARRAWWRWAAPAAALAAAAALVLVLPRPPPADAFATYRVEVAGVETMRGAQPSETLVVAVGAPFLVVLRPRAESSAPPRHVHVFARDRGGIREAGLRADVASSGAVRVSGEGEALGGADALIIVLTQREVAPERLRAALVAGEDLPSTKAFEVRVAHPE